MKILYVCTHNRCRSILCEALTNHLGGKFLRAASAGSQPAGKVHPLTIKHLAERQISCRGLRSKSWSELEGFQPEVVITVCDSAAGETCPLWMKDTLKLHWGLPDPSKVEGSEDDISQAFRSVITTIEGRIRTLLTIATGDYNRAQRAGRLQALAPRG